MKANQPKVSIVCITYNHEKFIAKALEGFINQKTDFPFEAIIGEDCSIDNTRKIIKDYTSKFPHILKPIYRKKNIGSLPNYCGALSKAKGQYVAVCDGDDYWIDEYKLQKQVDFLDTHPDYSMCCHPLLQTFIDKSSPDKILSPWEFVSEDAKRRGYLTFKDFFPINPVGSLSAMYRWGLRGQLPTWMKEYNIGDLVLHLLHADKGKVGVLEDVMAVYQRHPGGVWFENNTKENQQKIASGYFKLLTDIDHELNLKYTDIITPCKGNPLKILFVAMENSVHSYQWIQAVLNENHHVVQLYSSYRIPEKTSLFNASDKLRIYSSFKETTIRNAFKIYLKCLGKMIIFPKQVIEMMRNGAFGNGILVRSSKFATVKAYIKTIGKMILRPKQTLKFIENGTFGSGNAMGREKTLDIVIKEFEPDIIHTLHTQTSGYLLMNIRKNWKGNFPIWVHSIWGSDLYLWERIPGQKQILREFLSYVDYFIAEGHRDEIIASNLGYKGKFIGPMHATAGFDIEKIKSQNFIKPSLRNEIAVKGYDHGVGRFRDAIIGIINARDVLRDYMINVFSSEMNVDLINVYGTDSGLKFNVIPYGTYENIINMYSRSRIYIGCSFSDGVPASFLEAMAYGAFPIQTNTAITDEWVVDGITAILVPPDDTSAIERAIRLAVADDQLVDNAAEKNYQTICEKADNKNRRRTIQKIYYSVGYGVQ